MRNLKRRSADGVLLPFPKDCIRVHYEGDPQKDTYIISSPEEVKLADSEEHVESLTELTVGTVISAFYNPRSIWYTATVLNVYRANESTASSDDEETLPDLEKSTVTDTEYKPSEKKSKSKSAAKPKVKLTTEQREQLKKEKLLQKQEDKRIKREAKLRDQENNMPKLSKNFAKDAAELSGFGVAKVCSGSLLYMFTDVKCLAIAVVT